MPERKLIIEVEINDDAGGSIEDPERVILFQDICGQAARKYLDSLQDYMTQQAKMGKGSKKVHIKTSHFEFGFHAKRTLDEVEKNVYNTLSAQPGQKFTRFHTLPFVEISAHNSPIFGGIFSNRHLAGD